ncbi:MAG: leucyl aminopeptidase [Acidiferrobacterales bacterium]|nr:leucyl aminopeptidase [Acidiferrobacterales bacterium]
MNYQVKANKNLQLKTESLVVLVKPQKKLSSQQAELNKLTNGLIDQLDKSRKFKADKGQIVNVPLPSGIAAENLLLVGCGDPKKLTTESLRNLLIKVAKQLKANKVSLANFDLAPAFSELGADVASRHLIEALGDSYYEYVKQPKAANAKKVSKKAKFIILSDDRKQQSAATKGAKTGLAIDNGKTLAKNLGNMPGNVCTPTFLASQARKLVKSHGLKVSVLSEKDMQELGMGSLLSVSKGSREPAKLIIMQYKGAKDPKQAPHALVGKGLTFDAGGISLKPAGKMDEMKYDMCGAASVFGTMVSAAELELPINIVGVVPSSENLPDGLANKPGDVVTSMSGQTIEILNTDAEGRLILCDALTYTKRFKPATVIDIATLTGAVIVALGHQTAGLMGNDQKVIDNLLAAGEISLDFAWQLPIKETYKQQLKSDYADLANIGGPTAGSITAGSFLSYFAEDFKWAHLDIAGTAWGGSAGKRATGRAVPILTQYLIDQS